MLNRSENSEKEHSSYCRRPKCISAIVVILSIKIVLLVWWGTSYTNHSHLDKIQFSNSELTTIEHNHADTIDSSQGEDNFTIAINNNRFLDSNLNETLQPLKFGNRTDCNSALEDNSEHQFDRVFAVISGFSISNELIKSANNNVHFILVGQENDITDTGALKLLVEKAWNLNDDSKVHLVFCRDHLEDNVTGTLDSISSSLKANFEAKGLKAVIFLDSESQFGLWPATSALSQGSHISRRNVGYLMAIALGAEFIVDLDGSQTLTHPDWLNRESLNAFKSNWEHPLIASLHSNVNNPYVLMGPRTNSDDKLDSANALKDIWPRGYPNSELVHKEVPTFHLIEEIETRMNERVSIENCFHFSNDIIQSLEDEWPDVDSGHENVSPLPVTFLPQSSRLSIHPSQFAPSNARSTVFSRHAFWALLLPGSVGGMVSDVWRGYIAQTFLHCTGSLLAFSAPFAKRAPHKESQTNEYSQKESKLSSRTHELIQFLSTFDCSQSSSKVSSVEFSNTLPYCLIFLYSKLVSKGFLEGEGDISLVHEWIKALNALDYQFPSFYPNKECLAKQDSLYQPSWDFADHSFCGESLETHSARECGNSLLTVVHINFAHKEVIPVWLALWQYVYPNPIFYIAQWKKDRNTGMCVLEPTSYFNVACNEKDEFGGLAYESMMHSLDRYPNYNNYLFIHDDAFMAHNTLETVINGEVSAICRVEHMDGVNGWSWNPLVQKSMAKLALQNEFTPNSVYRKYTEKYCPELYTDESLFTEGKFPYYQTMADIFVLKNSDVETFLLVINKYFEVDMFLEVGIPNLFRCALNATEIPFTTYWDWRRSNIGNSREELCGTNPPQILHPIWKLSSGGKSLEDWSKQLEMLIDIRKCDIS